MKTWRVLCAVGFHSWNRPRRIAGVKVRRCSVCHVRQAQQYPGPTWVTTVPIKRVRRKAVPLDRDNSPEGRRGDHV